MPKNAGNSIATAFDITTVDTNIKIFEDTISNTDSIGYYKFTIAENSKLNIKLSGLSQNVDLRLIDADGSQIAASTASGNADENIVQNLRAGTYYFYVNGGGTGTNYKIETSAISLGAIPVDNAGNTFDTAKNLGTLGTTAVVANDFVGNFNGLSTDSFDYYQFTITENSTVNLKLSGLSQDAALYLFDSQQGFVGSLGSRVKSVATATFFTLC